MVHRQDSQEIADVMGLTQPGVLKIITNFSAKLSNILNIGKQEGRVTTSGLHFT